MDSEVVKIDSCEDIYEGDVAGRTAFENFGIKYMFPWQRMVVANILEAYEYYRITSELNPQEKLKFDSENSDSFCKGRQIVLLPTGAGKSLCFQVPALLLDGPTLVIYPLLALMTDQQRRMEEGCLRSVTFRGGQSDEERKENFRKIKAGEAKIILANPEVLSSQSLLNELKTVGIIHVAIDEAHCVSEWGDSFRPAYLELGKILKELNPPVITAFTATASPSVLSRVAEILFEGLAHVVRSESDRKNIHYFVKYASAKKKAALLLAKEELHPMIIFCGTRNNCEDMARELNACFGSDCARFYHAGLEKKEKDITEKWFYESKFGILCATCAYGMGVDKKDIKTVVHLEAPATAEAYIQEAGRGGRDGSVAKAILLWSLDDSLKYGVFKKGSREAALKEFAETQDCRRQVLLDALGAEQAVCSGCDLCNDRQAVEYAESLPFRSKRKELKRIKATAFVSDWKVMLNLVKRRKNYFSEEELENEFYEKMNCTFTSQIGLKLWNHSDSVDVLNELKASGKVVNCGWLWKGKLKAVEKAD